MFSLFPLSTTCAICHSLASLKVLVIVSCSDTIMFSKILLFREYHIDQHIHGKRGPSLSLDGGRTLSLFPDFKPVLSSTIWAGSKRTLKGSRDQTLFAKRQWNNRWVVDLISPQCTQLVSISMPLLLEFSPVAIASSAHLQRNTFNFGEKAPFQMALVHSSGCWIPSPAFLCCAFAIISRFSRIHSRGVRDPTHLVGSCGFTQL